MDDLAKEARRAYYRAWRAKNKDKVRASCERYWTKRAEKEEAARLAAQEKEVKADE